MDTEMSTEGLLQISHLLFETKVKCASMYLVSI